MDTRIKRLLVPAVLVVAVLILPRLVTSNYWMDLINLSISLSVACLGLNIVLGYAGQLSLAQAAETKFGYRAGMDPAVEPLVGAYSLQDKEEFIR